MTARYKQSISAPPREPVHPRPPNFDGPAICGKPLADGEPCMLPVDHAGPCAPLPF